MCSWSCLQYGLGCAALKQSFREKVSRNLTPSLNERVNMANVLLVIDGTTFG